MSSPNSPSYRNIRLKNKQSPIEIKEKLRKSYRDKIQNSRHSLLNAFRGNIIENNVRNTLNEIFKNLYDFNNDFLTTEEEELVLKEIREELVKEELEWSLVEYEKYQGDNIDRLSEETNDVICPLCQKENFVAVNNSIVCNTCRISIKTKSSLKDIRNNIFHSVDKHGTDCNQDAGFASIPDETGTHIYLICSFCNDMQLIV